MTETDVANAQLVREFWKRLARTATSTGAGH